jgi:Domain of Unknown Function with PDB structure (DUF3857)/Transglutaminase-like superfamily
MSRATRALGFGVVLLAFLAPARAAVPDWFRQAAGQTLPNYPPDTDAVVLLDATDNTVNGAGEYIEHYRRVVKILRPDGREQGDLRVYLGRQEKLLSLHAWSTDSSGHEYELKEKDFTLQSPYEEGLYDDIVFRTATAPASAPGSVVALEYEVRRKAWVNELDWIFQEENPVREAEFSVQLPAGWECKGLQLAGGPNAPAPSPSGCQWTVHDVPRLEHEPHRPSYMALCQRMDVAFFAPGGTAPASWDGLARWYAGLTSGRRDITPEIAGKVQELTAGKTDFDSKLRALAGFLQSEVRYVGIEIGIGGFQPHPAGDIFHVRYGDCKDKATLLSTMLQAAGIASDYVLIDVHRGVVKPELPSVRFDHAIVAIELPESVDASLYPAVVAAKSGKRYLLFDPTDEYTPVGNLPSELQDTFALLVTGSGGELIHTPLLPPGANLLTREGHFILNSDGVLSGEVVETRSGDHAAYARSVLRHANQRERSQQLERVLNESLKGFTLEASDIQELDHCQKNLVLTLKFTAPQYGQTRGPLMLVRPRVLDEKSFEVETKPRHYPFVLGGASQETDTYEIELPTGYKVDDVPDPVKVDMGFASYQSKVEVTGSKVRYWRQLTVRDVRVSPEKIADLRKFEGTVGADEMSDVVLMRVP